VENNITNCEKCGLYKSSCVMSLHGQFTAKKVMGVGPKNAKIFLIGEALGQEEVIQQKPFVGSAGRFLNDFLTQAGLNRDELYISNIIKCRPPENRVPKPAEIKCCLPYLIDEIMEVKPKVICTLGSTALDAILNKKGITSIRGNIYEYELKLSTPIDPFDESAYLKIKVIPTYHPAFLLRRQEYPQLKEHFLKDLILVKKISEDNNYKIEKRDTNYIITSDIFIINNYIDKIREEKICSYDIETNGFDFLNGKIISISLSCKETEAISFKLDKFTAEEQKEIFKNLKDILESKEILKIAQNAKFDNKFLRTYGINVKLPLFDTMLAHFLIDENSTHGLKELAYRYTDMGGYDDELEKIFKEIKKKKRAELFLLKRTGDIQEDEFDEEIDKIDNYAIIPDEVLLPYGAGDADCTIRLYSIFKNLLLKDNLLDTFNLIMIPLQFVLTNTEYMGVTLDIEYMNQLEKELTDKIKDIEFRILEKPEILQAESIINSNIKLKSYKKFNLKSSKDLQILFYTVLRLNTGIKTKKGTGFSTNAATLQNLSSKSEIAMLILDYRKAKHDVSTYIEQLRNSLDPNNKSHTDYMLHGSVTGRIISHKPNLQNIPRDSNIKRLFIPDREHILISADYAQIEYRVWSNYSNDPNMLEDIKNNLDIHSEVARRVWPHLFPEGQKVEGSFRVKAKAVVFGLIYGRGINSLVKDLGITEFEANKIIDYILNKYPKAKAWLDNQRKIVRKDKQVRSLFGRIRRLPEIDSSEEEKVAEVIRQCCNAPVQSTASDVTSIATIRVYNNMKRLNLDSRLILSIHDALKYSVPFKEIDKSIDCITRGMCDPIKGINFPLKVELEIGPNWKDLILYNEFNKDRKKYFKEWNCEV